MVSRLLTLATQTTVCGLGADYCVSKDNIDCSPRGVVGLLRNFEPFIRSHTAVDLRVNEHPITPQLQEKQLRRLMALTLARISIPTGDLVNRELVEAMFFVLPILEKDLPLPDLKNTVYPLIAEKYEIKDPRSIERGIRNILEKVWDRTEKTLLKNYYDFPVSKDTGYPSPASSSSILLTLISPLCRVKKRRSSPLKMWQNKIVFSLEKGPLSKN